MQASHTKRSAERNWLQLSISVALLAWALGCRHHSLKPEAELHSGESYVPLNPKPVAMAESVDMKKLRGALPNETMRVSVGSVDASGAFTFGSAQLGAEGQFYTVVVDYIKYTTGYVPVSFTSTSREEGAGRTIHLQRLESLNGSGFVEFSNITIAPPEGSSVKLNGTKLEPKNDTTFGLKHKIPVYIGVGLRIQANVQVLKGNVQIGSLYGLGVAASAGKVAGSMVVQTLGIHGPGVSALLPLPSEINASTIQASMQSLAAIKAKLFDDNVFISPQVVALESPYSNSSARQLLISTIQSSWFGVDLHNGIAMVSHETDVVPQAPIVPQVPSENAKPKEEGPKKEGPKIENSK